MQGMPSMVFSILDGGSASAYKTFDDGTASVDLEANEAPGSSHAKQEISEDDNAIASSVVANQELEMCPEPLIRRPTAKVQGLGSAKRFDRAKGIRLEAVEITRQSDQLALRPGADTNMDGLRSADRGLLDMIVEHPDSENRYADLTLFSVPKIVTRARSMDTVRTQTTEIKKGARCLKNVSFSDDIKEEGVPDRRDFIVGEGSKRSMEGEEGGTGSCKCCALACVLVNLMIIIALSITLSHSESKGVCSRVRASMRLPLCWWTWWWVVVIASRVRLYTCALACLRA